MSMLILSDFPPEVIDTIIGVDDTSYVVIKLWLCGSFQLNTKLSKGLTYLSLESHQFGSFRLPRIIFQFNSLRYLSISSPSLTTCNSEWPKIMRSLPQTLEHLSVSHHLPFSTDDSQGADLDCIWNWDSDGIHKIETDFPRGKSCAIDFASLFPRLHTLEVLSTRPCLSSDLFPALPTSLTYLDASIELCYGMPRSQRKIIEATNNDQWRQVRQDAAEISHLSKLPPNIVHLKRVECNWYSFDGLDGFELMRRDFAENSPASLQTFIEPTQDALNDRPDICWLPKSVVEVDWVPSGWTPTFARAMPLNLQTLRIRDINVESYLNHHTNWVADLPRTLTAFHLRQRRDTVDFASYVHFLPPNLTHLSIECEDSRNKPFKFGDWNTITADRWPLKLKCLQLEGFTIDLQNIPNLPSTLESLTMHVRAHNLAATGESVASTSEKTKPMLHMAALPPKLTTLHLTWNESVSICFETTNTTLTSCSLSIDWTPAAISSETLALFPPSLTTLDFRNIDLHHSKSTKPLSYRLLPNLKYFRANSATVDWLSFAPRSLQTLKIKHLVAPSKSPLLATGQLFKHLPPTLTHLDVDFSSHYKHSIPPQELNHLTLLINLRFGKHVKMPSSILRLLPRTLRHLDINITEWNDNDLPDIPPRLHTCRFPEYTLKMAEHMSLRSLGNLWRPKPPIVQLAQSRVKQAAVEQ